MTDEDVIASLLRGRPLRQKLVLIVLAATGSALLLSALALLAYETSTYRSAAEADLSSQAGLLGQSLAPTLSFDDPKAASLALEAVRARPEIEVAAVFTADGRLFAWRADEPGTVPAAPQATGLVTRGERTELFVPIRQGDEVVGTVFLRGRYRIANRLIDYLGILALASAAGLGTGLLIYRRMHPSVTTPILAVADAAKRVMTEGDYTVRVHTRSDGEVGLLVEAFNGMLDALEREIRERSAAEDALRDADRRKDEFLAMMAHELRNPLAPLTTALALLRQAGDRPELRTRAQDTMERQLKQMVRLIDDLLDVSRITQGRLELRFDAVRIGDVVRQALEAVEPIVRAKRQTLGVEQPIPEAWVRMDAARMTQVVVNLLHNAAKYTPDEGRIGVAVDVQADSVAIVVTDDGIGIPVEDQAAIFDMFVQLDRSLSRSQGGLGIGLTIARQIVHLHRGRIEVASDGAGRGASFRVTLPRIEAPQPLAAAQPAAPLVADSLDVLIADDNQDFADTFAELLRTEGYKVRVRHDGEAALQTAREQPADVAFLDIGMPLLSGYDLARSLRADARTQAIRLIAVTGWGQDADKARVREAGFDEHWVKPVDLAQALQALARLAQRKRGGAAPAAATAAATAAAAETSAGRSSISR